MKADRRHWLRGASALALGSAALALLPGCTAVIRTPYARVVVREMPVPLVEERPHAPAHGWHWRPGHWAWHDNGWRWQGGEWVATAVPPMPAVLVEEVPAAPPSPAHVWVRGHWTWRGDNWHWVGGHWVIG